MERRLAAILAADVVGFSRLMGEDEARTLDRLKSLRNELVQPKISGHRGRVVKLMGDGLLAEFPSIVEAVNCAVAIQKSMAEREFDLPDQQRIKLRIGVNLGDIIVEGSDIYGDGVNISARLEQLAEPGGICLSGAARDQVSGKVDTLFEPIGVQNLKNIAEPVAVYRIKLSPSQYENAKHLSPYVDTATSGDPSIAVLPFQNMSADPEQEFFADGLTEDIITRLSYLRDLSVISRTSSFAYKNRVVRVEDVARDLGVAHVLEGSVRKAGNRVRITAQLIDGSTGGHIWAQRYDRELNDIFAIQDEITHAIVVAMQVNLTDGEVANRDIGGTQNIDAWENFLRGVVAFLKYTIADNLTARHLFETALRLDPNYLDAKTYLAWTHFMDAHREQVKDVAGSNVQASRLLGQINASGAELANAKYLESLLFMIGFQFDEALEAAKDAVNLGPCRLFGYAPAAKVQIWCGNPQSAFELCRSSMRLSPFCPIDVLYHMAYALIWLGDHKNSIRAANEYLRRNPDDIYAYTLQATAFDFAGDKNSAAMAIRKLRDEFPEFNLSSFASHELYRDPEKLDRIVTALRDAGLPD